MIRELHEAEAEHRARIRNLHEENLSHEQFQERYERLNREYKAIFNHITSTRLGLRNLISPST